MTARVLATVLPPLIPPLGPRALGGRDLEVFCVNLTPKQLALMSVLAGYDVPERLLPRVNCSLSVGQLARALLQEPPPCGPEGEGARALEAILRDEALLKLWVTDYINHNHTNGFVGYAFEDARGAVLAAFRGSESTHGCAPSNVDWWDNVRAPLLGSAQYDDVRRFAARHARRPLLFTGHSKGAHNALYALATSQNTAARAVVFDAQGFARGQLSEAERAALEERALNYVQRDDVVGALLWHPERRIFAQGVGEGNPHALSAMAFDEAGYPIPARRTLRSRAAGIMSRALYERLQPRVGGSGSPEGNALWRGPGVEPLA